VGISNSRLLDDETHASNKDQVTFRTKDGRKISLHPVMFLRRFIQHVLPDGFKKIRHAGLYASAKALAKAKAFLGPAPEPTAPQPTWQEALLALTGVDATRCRGCGAPIYHVSLPRAPSQPGSVPRFPRFPGVLRDGLA
jgi:hypothetical protein